jgi:hypothetical protein
VNTTTTDLYGRTVTLSPNPVPRFERGFVVVDMFGGGSTDISYDEWERVSAGQRFSKETHPELTKLVEEAMEEVTE